MNVKELNIDSALYKAGTAISAGQSKQKSTTKTATAQYPAERPMANDSTQDLRVNDLYKNGLLFTAYDFNSRTSGSLRANRMDGLKGITKNPNSFNLLSSIENASDTESLGSVPVANILLPRSKSDNDSVSHRFNDVGESLAARGGGTVTGILSNMASSAIFGAMESITQGSVLADRGEQIYTTARSMYSGPDNRTKVFTWELTPRTVQDLNQILRIYELFNYYSYGETGKSAVASELKEQIDEWYKSTFKKEALESFDGQLAGEAITSFLSNVIVVSNPTIWYIRNFGQTSSYDGRSELFGPAQIQSIRFDRTPDGQFNGLAIAPNMPNTFVLEITFREILTLNRGSLYLNGVN